MTAPTATSVRAGDREREQTANQLGSGARAGLPRDGRVRDPAAGHVLRAHHRRTASTRRRPAAGPDAPQRPAAASGTPRSGAPRRADPSGRVPRDGRHRAHGVARGRPHRRRLVLLARSGPSSARASALLGHATSTSVRHAVALRERANSEQAAVSSGRSPAATSAPSVGNVVTRPTRHSCRGGPARRRADRGRACDGGARRRAGRTFDWLRSSPTRTCPRATARRPACRRTSMSGMRRADHPVLAALRADSRCRCRLSRSRHEPPARGQPRDRSDSEGTAPAAAPWTVAEHQLVERVGQPQHRRADGMALGSRSCPAATAAPIRAPPRPASSPGSSHRRSRCSCPGRRAANARARRRLR